MDQTWLETPIRPRSWTWPARRANVALATASVVAMLYAIELVLAMAAPGTARLREKLARLDELRRQGRDPSPGVEPVRFVWSHEPGITPGSVTMSEVFTSVGYDTPVLVMLRATRAPA